MRFEIETEIDEGARLVQSARRHLSALERRIPVVVGELDGISSSVESSFEVQIILVRPRLSRHFTTRSLRDRDPDIPVGVLAKWEIRPVIVSGFDAGGSGLTTEADVDLFLAMLDSDVAIEGALVKEVFSADSAVVLAFHAGTNARRAGSMRATRASTGRWRRGRGCRCWGRCDLKLTGNGGRCPRYYVTESLQLEVVDNVVPVVKPVAWDLSLRNNEASSWGLGIESALRRTGPVPRLFVPRVEVRHKLKVAGVNALLGEVSFQHIGTLGGSHE